MGNDSGNKVGYRNPPRHSRFAKGRSGNPRGRRKGSKNLATLLSEELEEPVTINKNGRPRKLSKLAVTITQLVNKAASGDPKHMHQLLSLVQTLEDRAEARTPSAEPFTADDREVIALIHDRLKRHDDGGTNG